MQLKCFIAAAECLNFTEAASKMYITQPAFSRNIAALEREWGVELFRRSDKHSGTRLTAAGVELYDGMRELAARYDELLEHARATGDGRTGRLTVGLLSGNRIDDRERALLNAFSCEYPNVEVVLRRGLHSELVQWLRDRTLDVAFTLLIDVEEREWIKTRELYSAPSVVLVPSDHPLCRMEAPSLSDLRGETFLNLSSDESAAINRLLVRECEKLGFTPKTVELPNIQEQILYVESGRGVAIGSVNNTAAYSTGVAAVNVAELRPLRMAAAWSSACDNPALSLFINVMST